ncbi:hypothetical protein ACLMJK_002592 [Lecanora helva]
MPNLKQLICNVQWEGSSTSLQEFQTAYGDGYVETYIAVPETPLPFSIHLRSNGYIAPGLGVFVYMDGVYQCNRFRRNLKFTDENTSKQQTEVDFVLYQQEQMQADGTFIAMPWRFSRVNIVSNPTIDEGGNAPHNGEYIGTIEVIILRCCPDESISLDSVNTLIAHASSSSPEVAVPVVTTQPMTNNDKSGYPKPKHESKSQRQPRSQPKSQRKEKTKANSKAKRHIFGLDGAWDEPEISKEPVKKEYKVQNDPWENWTMPLPSTEKPSTGLFENRTAPSSSNMEPRTGAVKMTSASEGIYQPIASRKKAASDAGSEKGSQRRPSRAGWQAGPGKDKLDTSWNAPKKTNENNEDSLHLRGGGSRTQSINSRDSTGRKSPLVVNNSIVYNGAGTPPPLSAGPPPPRQFWAEIDAKQRVKDVPKATSKPAPAVDPWDNFAYDAKTDPTTKQKPNAEEKVSGWDTGGSAMPGGWDAPNKAQDDNNAWGASADAPSNENNAWSSGDDNSADKQNGNTFGNGAGEFDWDKTEESPPNNGETWGDLNEPGSGNGENYRWGNYDSNENQPQDNLGVDIGNNDSVLQDRDNRPTNGHRNDDTWPVDNAPTQVGKEGKKNQIQNHAPDRGWNWGSTVGPGSNKAQPSSSKSKTKGSFFNWFNPSGKTPEDAASPPAEPKAPTPGPWKSTLSHSQKGTTPKKVDITASESKAHNHTQARSIVPLTTTPSTKPYWATWKDPYPLEKTKDDDRGAAVETPIYTISESLAERNKTSHQVRPSLPAKYTHRTSKPRYMDTMEQPYAVFTFHYRDKEIIEELVNISITEPEEDEKGRLLNLPKGQLVDELIRAKSQSNSNDASGSRRSSDKATFKSNPHNIPMGPSASALTKKLSKLESSKAPTPEKVGGWLDTASEDRGNGGNGADTWGQNNSYEANTNGQGTDAWGNRYANQGQSGNNDTWDNNAEGTTLGDTWNNNNEAAGADDWVNNIDNHTSTNNNNTNAWDNGGDSWGNFESNQAEDHTNNEHKEDNWGTSGFSGIDTSWGGDESKGKGKEHQDNTGGGVDSWDFGGGGW